MQGNRPWLEDSVEAYLQRHQDEFPPGTSVTHSGSLFAASQQLFGIHVYSNPARIVRDHEGVRYTVSAPVHVAALHAMRAPDAEAALRYLIAHHDAQRRVPPLVATFRARWVPGDDPRLSQEPLEEGEGRIRYTLHGWRKREAHQMTPEYHERVRYIFEHWDTKEVLDAEGNVLSSEQAPTYRPEIESAAHSQEIAQKNWSQVGRAETLVLTGAATILDSARNLDTDPHCLEQMQQNSTLHWQENKQYQR
ncbi:hypothetical protein FB451DRAFT_1162086 [Mycena latifolia]|nr:hypothetical protein FB451DRAFT_1162086 [Mycena latifolia]